jgi:hypothetical protein
VLSSQVANGNRESYSKICVDEVALVRGNFYCTFSALLLIAFCEAIINEFSELASIDTLISQHTNKRKIC